MFIVVLKEWRNRDWVTSWDGWDDLLSEAQQARSLDEDAFDAWTSQVVGRILNRFIQIAEINNGVGIVQSDAARIEQLKAPDNNIIK